MKYYAAQNSYGNESSTGFANTWQVLVFESKTARDKFVKKDENRNISTRSITRTEIKDYVPAPKPFSGLRRAIDTRHDSDWMIGTIGLMYEGEGIDL